MSAKAEKLTQVLENLEQNSEVMNSAIVSSKGQVMASALHEDVDESAVGAMTAAMTSVGNRVADTLESGDTESLVIHGSGNLIMVDRMAEATLIAIAPAEAKVGLIDYEVNTALDEIEKTLG